MEIPTLSKSFYIPGGKTLKLEIKPETKLAEAVEDARNYLETNDCPHNKVEFKFGRCYIVVAKLRRE
jgi:hypothetical protein